VPADDLAPQARLAPHLDGDLVGADLHVVLRVELLDHVGAVLRHLALRCPLAVERDGEGRLALPLRPAGSIVSRQVGARRRGLPGYVAVPHASSVGLAPGYFGGSSLGPNHGPFRASGGPSGPDPAVRWPARKS
jgi:hypothetical protein